MVRAMVIAGVPETEIAQAFALLPGRRIGISPTTLRTYFRTEIDMGKHLANAKVVANLFRMASTGDNPAAAIYWTKTQLGWRDVQHVSLSGKLTHEVVKGIDVSSLTDDELAQLRAGEATDELLARIALAARTPATAGSGGA